mmetsp:Transcript_104447/g.336826  ORF Transcript_104447/g.336826 Transcript_104447/m.336826 type:complete len:200 (-) Transcript_104447:452-1051(-)
MGAPDAGLDLGEAIGESHGQLQVRGTLKSGSSGGGPTMGQLRDLGLVAGRWNIQFAAKWATCPPDATRAMDALMSLLPSTSHQEMPTQQRTPRRPMPKSSGAGSADISPITKPQRTAMKASQRPQSFGCSTDSGSCCSRAVWLLMGLLRPWSSMSEAQERKFPKNFRSCRFRTATRKSMSSPTRAAVTTAWQKMSQTCP